MNTISGAYSVAGYGVNVSGELGTSTPQKNNADANDSSNADNSADDSGNFIEQLTYQANAKILRADNLTIGSLMDVLDTPLRA